MAVEVDDEPSNEVVECEKAEEVERLDIAEELVKSAELVGAVVELVDAVKLVVLRALVELLELVVVVKVTLFLLGCRLVPERDDGAGNKTDDAEVYWPVNLNHG